MNTRNAVVLFAAAVSLAACSTTSKTGFIEDEHLGEAKARTMAAQIIEPAPVYEYLDPPTSGEHAAKAVDRYRKGAAKQPERVSSTASSSGSQ